MVSPSTGSPQGSTLVEASLSEVWLPPDTPTTSLHTPCSNSSAALAHPRAGVSSFLSRRQLSRTASVDLSAAGSQSSRPASTVPRLAQFARPNSSFPSRQRTAADQRIFKIPKGVHTFDYSVDYNVVVTGGLDQVMRVWNPYMTKYVCVYTTHTFARIRTLDYVRTYVCMYVCV